MHLLYRLVNVINLVCSLQLSLLKQGLSEPEFYGDLVYKFRKYFGGDFSDQLKNIIRYKRTGYNVHVMRQSACLVVNPITINNFPLYLHADGSCIRRNEGSGLKCSIQLVGARCSVFGRAQWGSTVGYLLLQRFIKGLAVEYSSCFNSVLLDLDLYVCCFDA